MQEQYKLVCVLLLFISGYRSQDPPSDWNGDPRICTVSPSMTTVTTSAPISSTTSLPTTSPASSLPQFSNQAEYRLERVIIRHESDVVTSNEMTLYHRYYDYDNNKFVDIENKNGSYDIEYFDYDRLKRSTYYFQNRTCTVGDIRTNDDTNGNTAIQVENGTWHIRPLNEFLLFSINTPGQEVTPVYLGKERIRGIPVNQWESCFINRTTRRTVRRVWSFAERGVLMPSGRVEYFAIPVQAISNSSIVDADDVQTREADTVYNILSYRPSLTRSILSIPQPRGIFCENIPEQQMVSLRDVGITWPYRFNVRVEASTSKSSKWERFHLYYHQGEDEAHSRLRYDYLPPDASDYTSIIHDYTDNLTYTIDRRLGTCDITRGVEIPDVDPLADPIRFFVKNEARFITAPPEKAWEYRGIRQCLTNTVECAILTASIKNFPPLIEPDESGPSGETWDTTNIEYAWATRAANTPSFPNGTKRYDYPVSLFLRMNRHEDSSALPTQTADVEYEFYEMSHDANLNQFDVSTCYRSNQYEYLHLVFTLTLNRGDIADSQQLNRRRLDEDLHYNLINRMQIRYSRITDLELDYEEVSNNITVFFTILGQTRNPDVPSGMIDDEATAAQARDTIQQVIDDGQFEFEMRLRDGSVVEFRGEPSSLKSSKQYMSTHSFGKKVVNESYTVGSQVTAALVGILIGLFVGVILAGVLRIVRKQPMPALPGSIANPLPSVNFNSRKRAETTSDA